MWLVCLDVWLVSAEKSCVDICEGLRLWGHVQIMVVIFYMNFVICYLLWAYKMLSLVVDLLFILLCDPPRGISCDPTVLVIVMVQGNI